MSLTETQSDAEKTFCSRSTVTRWLPALKQWDVHLERVYLNPPHLLKTVNEAIFFTLSVGHYVFCVFAQDP